MMTRMWIAAMGVMLGGAAAWGQTRPAPLFPKGTVDFDLTAAAAKDWDRSGSYFGSTTAGLGYYFVDNVSINAELAGYFLQQDGTTQAGSLTLLLRHHFYTNGRFSLFADVGGSVFEARRDLPVGGTHFNFMFRSGLGATYRIADNTNLIGGIHYVHLSNARIRGYDRNPSLNGFEGYMGVMWTF